MFSVSFEWLYRHWCITSVYFDLFIYFSYFSGHETLCEEDMKLSCYFGSFAAMIVMSSVKRYDPVKNCFSSFFNYTTPPNCSVDHFKWVVIAYLLLISTFSISFHLFPFTLLLINDFNQQLLSISLSFHSPLFTLFLSCYSFHSTPFTLLLSSWAFFHSPAYTLLPFTLMLPSLSSSLHTPPPFTLLLPSLSSLHPPPPFILLLPSLSSSLHSSSPFTLSLSCSSPLLLFFSPHLFLCSCFYMCAFIIRFVLSAPPPLPPPTPPFIFFCNHSLIVNSFFKFFIDFFNIRMKTNVKEKCLHEWVFQCHFIFPFNTY